MFKRLITVHHYHDVSFSPKTTKPGNEDLFNTKGQGSAGEEVSSGWGGGGGGVSVHTVTVTLFQTLFAVVKRRMMKNPPFPYCNLRENFMVYI